MKKSAKVLILCIVFLIIAIGVVILLIARHRDGQNNPRTSEPESVENLLPDEDDVFAESSTTLSSSDTSDDLTTIDSIMEEIPTDMLKDQSDDDFLPEDSFD